MCLETHPNEVARITVTPKRIVVTKRLSDYHACLEGHPEIWDCAKDRIGAVGNLIVSHRERFNIEIEDA